MCEYVFDYVSLYVCAYACVKGRQIKSAEPRDEFCFVLLWTAVKLNRKLNELTVYVSSLRGFSLHLSMSCSVCVCLYLYVSTNLVSLFLSLFSISPSGYNFRK